MFQNGRIISIHLVHLVLSVVFYNLCNGINRYLVFFQISISFWETLDSERGQEAAAIPSGRSLLKIHYENTFYMEFSCSSKLEMFKNLILVMPLV